MRHHRALAVAVAIAACASQPSPATPDPRLASFEHALDSLAILDRLPGYSAIVVMDGAVAWRHGFGFADVEGEVSATPDTPYRLASLTKPIAATLLMRLVEQGRLALDDRMNRFTIHPWFEPGEGDWAHYPSRYDDTPITVRHVLTHTSQATPPGDEYAYSGNIFGDLTWVLESATRESYPILMRDSILIPLGMLHSLPGQLAPWGDAIVAELATPYDVADSTTTRGAYPGFGLEDGLDVSRWGLRPAYHTPAETDRARRVVLGERYTPLYSSQTASGMISTVEDLARFDITFDSGQLVSAATRALMLTPAHTSAGTVLPYGLGWFSEQVAGQQVAWHYGWFPPTVSALYVKLPERGITFILLSNSDRLSADRAWTREGIQTSPYARLFLGMFGGT